MFIHPITMCLMLLSILNHIGVNKMTGRIVDAFAVKHPSNQAFTNEGLRTSYPEARARTQLAYANDVGKYDDCADDNNENEKDWRKINYQIKSLISNDERQKQRPLLLIEKTRVRWLDCYFKNFYQRNILTSKLFINYNKMSDITQSRKTRDTYRLYNTKPKAKLIDRMSHDDSITLIPTAKLDRVLSKVFQESLQQDESLANIHEENSMGNVKINLPSIRFIDDIQSEVTQNSVKSYSSQLQSNDAKFHINNMTKLRQLHNTSFNTKLEKLNRDKLMISNKFINLIQSINPTNIRNLHRALNRNTMSTVELNFHRLQPQQFVLAPTKFVDDIKILPASFELIHSHQSNAVKGILNKQINAKFNLKNETTIKNNNTERIIFINSTSDIDFFPSMKSPFTQITQANNLQNVAMINLVKLNRQQKPNSQMNYLRYAEKYDFAYRITDDKTRNYFGHGESRNEGVTNGHYHVLLPNGRIQEVKYRVDKGDGYRANVTYHNQIYG